MNIVKSYLNKHKKMFIFIGILLFFGIVSGFISSHYIDIEDQQYLIKFLTLVNHDLDKYAYFISNFLSGIVLILILFFCGTSIIGSFLISFIIFTKGVQIGFSCALFFYMYQIKGILAIIFMLLPQIIFDLISVFIISASALSFSMRIIGCCIQKTYLQLHKVFNSLLNDILICFVITFIASYLKATIMIELIKLFHFS